MSSQQAIMTLIFSKLKLTFCMTIKSSFSFERINNVECDFSQWQIFSFVCPLQYHVTLLSSWMIESLSIIHAFIPSVLKRVQRWRVSRIGSIVALFLFPTTAPFSQISHSYFRVPFIFASFLLSESLEQIMRKQ